MSGNKRVRKAKPDTALVDKAPPAKKRQKLQTKEQELQLTVHRLEVEIAAASRLAVERQLRNRDYVPPPEPATKRTSKDKKRLTLSQVREHKQRKLMQVLEFFITALLLVGACAWLYQWWATRSGG